jgi:hypothetical protein
MKNIKTAELSPFLLAEPAAVWPVGVCRVCFEDVGGRFPMVVAVVLLLLWENQILTFQFSFQTIRKKEW